MKSKLSMKLLGIVVTIATVSSLLVGITAAPVSAAPGTLNYGSVSAPGNANNVLGGTAYHVSNPVPGPSVPDGFGITGTPNVNLLASTADGSTMFAWDNTCSMLYTSTNAGVSWTPRPYNGTNLSSITNAIKLLVSPNFASDNTIVLVVGGATGSIWVSTNAGVSFTQSSPPDLEGGSLTSADIGTYYSDGGAVSVIIGMTSGGGVPAYSNVEKLKLPSLYPWTQIGKLIPGAGNATDLSVYGVAFSKNHTSDAEILAVTASATGTGASTLQLMSSFANAAFTNAAAIAATSTASTTAIIAMGTDYNGFSSSNTVAIGLSATSSDDVYRVSGRTNALAGSVIDCNIQGALTATTVQSLSMNGPIATGTLLVGFTVPATLTAPAAAAVYSTAAFTAAPAPTFTPSADPPTGTDASGGCTVLWVGTTVFAASTGPDGGISSSTDNGAHFNQLSLINVGAGSGAINPAPWVAASTSNLSNMSLVSLQAVDANNMFLIMANSNIGSGYAAQQLWVTANGGTSWTRVLTSNNMGVIGGAIAFVAPSPAYATDHTFYVSQGTTGTTNTVLMSTNSGMSFTLSIASANQSAGMMKNGALYYGGVADATFYKLGRWNSGSFPAGTTGTVASIAFSPADTTGATIAVGLSGGKGVYVSTNDGVSFTKLAAFGTLPIFVAYGPDGSLYAASGAVINRWVPSTASFLTISPTSGTKVDGPTTITGLAVTPDGTLYASDSATCTVTDPATVVYYNDIWRTLNPTKGDVTGVGSVAFQPINSTAFTSNSKNYLFSGMSVVSTAASNSLYAVDTTSAAGTGSGVDSGYGGKLQGFIDTFIVGPVLTSPANGALLTTQDRAALAWTAMTGANQYEIGANDKSDFTGNNFAGADTTVSTGTDGYNRSTAPNTTFTDKGNTTNQISAGGTYYWRVRAYNVINGAVVGALYSRYSTPTWSFITALAAPTSNTVMFPAQGATNIPVDTTFTWPASTATGATYQFVIAEELGNVDKFAIIDYSATCPTNATVLRETLKYDTTYWWRVRTVTATSQSDWTVYFFTTAPAPAASTTTPTTAAITPIVTVVLPTNSPVTPTVINSGTTGPTTPVIPTYLLWAVIAVGAVLVIAVIVLIVRTRRIP
jgi:hypothetical protein